MKLVILHTNDTHGHLNPLPNADGQRLGGYARRATFVQQQRAAHENLLLVDAGDFYQSSRYWHAFHGEPDIALMNQLGYDVAALGNHDFDGGLDLLAARIRQADFPLLCANIVPEPHLQKQVFRQSSTEGWDRTFLGNCELAGAWNPWHIKVVDGVRVGFFSLLVDDLHLYRPEFAQTMRCRPIHETARQMVDQLREQTDALILLSHLGHDEDVALAGAVDGIDLIIGGHTHTPLHEICWVNHAQSRWETPIARGVVGGQLIGRVELAIERAAGRRERSCVRGYGLVALDDSFADDEEVAREVARWTARLPDERELGQLLMPIDTTQGVKAGGESAAGNLYVDALLAIGGSTGDSASGSAAQLAFAHMGTLRGDRAYGPGHFTNLDLSEYHPFPNRPTTRQLSGPQIKSLLERGVSALPEASACFVAVAGLRVYVDLSRQPQRIDIENERVLTGGERVREVAYRGESLDLSRSDLHFNAVMDEFMGKGGAGFFFIKNSPVLHQSDRSGAEFVADYFEQHGPIRASVEGRIRIGG